MDTHIKQIELLCYSTPPQPDPNSLVEWNSGKSCYPWLIEMTCRGNSGALAFKSGGCVLAQVDAFS